MNLVKTVTVKLGSLILKGGYTKDIDEGHVEALQEELRRGNSLPPIAIDRQRNVLWGYHRVLAHRAEGIKSIRADVVEFTSNEDREACAIAENLKRRYLVADERARQTKRLVELRSGGREKHEVDAQVREFTSPAQAEPGTAVPNSRDASRPGPAKSARGLAREKVAKELGRTPEAVKRADNRARKKEREAATNGHANSSAPAPLPSPIETLGVAVPDSVLGAAAAVKAALSDADRHLRAAQVAVTSTKDVAGWTGNYQLLKTELHRSAVEIRDAMPRSVCPYCKCTRLQPKCLGCQARGWVTERQFSGAPKGLLDIENPLVARDGKFIPMIQVRDDA